MVIHRFPGSLSINGIGKAIGKIEKHLLLKDDTFKSDFLLQVTSEQSYSILSILILYKFMLYTVIHKLFERPRLLYPEKFQIELERFGFKKLFEKILSANPEKSYNYSSEIRDRRKNNEFIILPHTLGNPNVKKQNKLENDLAVEINKFYKNEAKLDVILTCLTEILSNFYAHSLDEDSILVAQGNQNKVSIYCIDTGAGIVETLRESHIKYKNLKSAELLREAVQNGITSKSGSNHSGHGLSKLKGFVELLGGKLSLHSQGGSYVYENGKEFVEKCGYWPGSIVALRLNLETVEVNKEFIAKVSEKNGFYDEISLNIV